MVVSLTIKRLLSSTIDGTASLCVYDANHNGEDLSVTISCPVASGCCEKGCCKLPASFITGNSSSTFSEEHISSTNQVNETVLLITLTLMIFFFGCISVLFLFRKMQSVRQKNSEPDFVYHAYRPQHPKVSSSKVTAASPSVILTDYRLL